VKLQTLLTANALPARSMAPVVSVALFVLVARLPMGANVATLPREVTTPEQVSPVTQGERGGADRRRIHCSLNVAVTLRVDGHTICHIERNRGIHDGGGWCCLTTGFKLQV